MRNIQNIYMAGLLGAMVLLGMTTFYGGMLAQTDVTPGDFSALNSTFISSYEQTDALKNETQGVIASNTNVVSKLDSLIGGLFKAMMLPFHAVEIFRELIGAMATTLHIPTFATDIIIIAIGLVVLIEIMKFFRGISG